MAVHEWFCEHANVVAHVERVADETLLGISAITVGEITCGHMRSHSTDPARRAEFETFVAKRFPRPWRVSEHAGVIYGELKAELFKKYPPQSGTRFVYRCYDSLHGCEIGIDENDLWIAAQAIELNLVLVSADRMKLIKRAAGSQLKWEDWRLPISAGEDDASA
jgi:tRNA(fMet)-specific endonuclease VapC